MILVWRGGWVGGVVMGFAPGFPLRRFKVYVLISVIHLLP